MLEAVFTDGVLSVKVVGLTQWDYGQQLKIKGLGLSSNVEVHFSNNGEKEAIVMQASASGNDLVVDIPNVILEKDKDITAYVYTDTGTSGETIRMVYMPVYTRVKPADFVSDQTSKEVENWVEQAQEYAESAQANAETVQEQVDRMDDILANVPDFDSYETLAQAVSDIETLQTTVGGHTTTIEGLQTDTETNATDIKALEKEFYEGKKVDGMSYTGKTSDKGVQLVKVQGKTVQNGTPSPDSPVEIENVKITEVTSHGRQLFDQSKLPNRSQGGATVTNNGDGSFTISGGGNLTEYFNNAYIYSNEQFKKFIKKGQLKLNVGSSNPKVSITFYDDSVSPSKVYVDLEDGRNSGTITDEILNNSNMKMRIGFYGLQNSAIETATVKPMLYQEGDGTWEEFKLDTIETNLTLAQDDTYENNQITRARKQITFDGSSDEAWRAIANNRFQITVQDVARNGYSTPKGVCNRLQPVSLLDMGTTAEWGIISCHNGSIYIRVSENITTVEQLQTWLSTHNLVVEYELKTSTTEEFKIPTVPSYFDFTDVSTDNEVTTDMTWKVLADCDNTLKQEELERRIEALEQNALEV